MNCKGIRHGPIDQITVAFGVRPGSRNF